MAQDDAQATPKRRVRSDQFSGLMLVAFALYVVWANRVYPVGTVHVPGPGFMPLALAIFFGSMGLLIAAGGARSRPLIEMRWTEAKRAVTILLAAVVGVVALEAVGYRLTIMVLLVFLMGVIERKPPVMVAILSIGFAFLSYYVVADLLLVPLPRSPWGF
ncbi:MAG: tripartite tricarboxylate transporter TctB family protein [Betaproteobacteria bacterium]|nr:tripartite tricarboxylate transporter TctB family protein [Betaproteobacteria bacterium]MDH3436143.1 tripartite tricarboxylate transporter TctB family protein [Betaproteobacteria bacterium]